MGHLCTETGRVIAITSVAQPTSQIMITITTSEGESKQIFLYQGRQPLSLVEGEEVSCIVNDTGTTLQGLALVNLSRHIHQETPPRSMYFQNQCIFFIAYLIIVEVICLIFFDPRHGNTGQLVLFMGVFFLSLLPITPYVKRWSINLKEAHLLMTRVRQLLQEFLAAQGWGCKPLTSPQSEGGMEMHFPQNKKGQFFVRILRPAPGALIETPRICPFCVEAAVAGNIGSQTFDETLSIMRKPLLEPPVLKVHVCDHHFTNLGPRALAGENVKMVLAIFIIELGVPLIVSTINFLGSDYFSAFIILYIICAVVANVLFFTFGFKRILRGYFEKEEKFHFGSWRRKQVTLYAKNYHWLTEFAQMHPELLAPVHEIQN